MSANRRARRSPPARARSPARKQPPGESERLFYAYGSPPPHPPLREVRRKLDVRWYRCPVGDGKLAKFMERSDGKAWVQCGGHLLLFCATAALVLYCWRERLWACVVGALFAHGTVASCFLFGCHELGHGTVFRTKWLNRAFLYAFSFLSLWDPFDYALSHTYHHRYTLYPAADRENDPQAQADPTASPLLVAQLFSLMLLGGPDRTFGRGGLLSHIYYLARAACGLGPGSESIPANEWLAAVRSDQPREVRHSMVWSRIVLLGHAAACAAPLVGGAAYAPVPLLVTTASFSFNWLRYLMGSTQHMGLPPNVPDFRKCVRTITLPPPLEFLYWRMNYHTEHHMFAGVPCYHLKALHAEVAHDMPAPRTLLGAWAEMRAVWARQRREPGYAYDTPLPSTAGRGGAALVVSTDAGGSAAEAADAASSSIGELAPEGLRG